MTGSARGPRALVLAALAGAVARAARDRRDHVVGAWRPRGARRGARVLGRRRSGDVERRPERAERDRGRAFTPGQTVFRTVAYRQYTKDFAKQIPNGPGNPGLQGPLLHAPRRRQDRRPLPEPRHADEPAALDALPRRALPVRLGRRVHPGLLGAGRERQAGRDVHVPVRGRAERARRVAVPRPLALDDGVDRGRPVRRALDPRAGRGPPRTASSSSTSSAQLGFNTINGRAFVGNTPVFSAKVGEVVQWDVLAIGERLPHVPRPRSPLAAGGRHPARHAGDRAGGELPRPLARGHARARGCTTATSRSHMMNGMIAIYRVSR